MNILLYSEKFHTTEGHVQIKKIRQEITASASDNQDVENNPLTVAVA